MKKPSKRRQEELNEERLLAHQIIAELHEEEAKSHLRLLLNHCKSCLIELGDEDAEKAE